MKKLWAIVLLLLLVTSVYAAQVGVRITGQIPEHGHSGAKDGGILNVPSFSVKLTNDQQLAAPTNYDQQVAFTTILSDNVGGYDSNVHRYFPKVPGTYRFSVSIGAFCDGSMTNVTAKIIKNNTGITPHPYTLGISNLGGSWVGNDITNIFTESIYFKFTQADVDSGIYYVEIQSSVTGTANCYFAGSQVRNNIPNTYFAGQLISR